MNTRILSSTAAGLLAGFLAGPLLAATPDVATTIARHRVDEAPAPVRENPLWRAPQKILLLQYNAPRWAGSVDGFRAAAGGAQVIVATDTASAIAAAADVDAIIGFNPEICSPQIISAAKRARWVASLSAGVEDCMEVPEVKPDRLMMTNMRGIDSPAIAEHAIALTLSLAKGLDKFMVDTSNGTWSRDRGASVRMQSLEGKTMLIAGLGGIGTEIARRAAGLGMTVVATRQGGSGKPDYVSYIGEPDELLALTATADVVVCALPLTAETKDLFDAKFFNSMKPTAFFVNIARGGSVVTADLVAALNSGRIAGAGLDVVEPEPLPAEHPLWKSPRVIITPHIASGSDLPGDARWTIAHENLRRYVAGEKMLLAVDIARGY